MAGEIEFTRKQLQDWRKQGEFRLGGYFGGGSLDARGRVVRESQTQSLAARLWFERQITGDTTDAIGLLKSRPWASSPQASESRQRRGREPRVSARAALRMPMLLSIPMRRDMRVETPNGVTSFHFAHEVITKGQHADRNVTTDFAQYMERDEAVAEVLAREAQRHGMASAHIGYIGRPGAVAKDLYRPAIFSNIPAERRLDVWRSIEALEKEPRGDQLTIDYQKSPSFWDALAEDERCPEVVRDGILAARSSGADKPRKIVTLDNERLRAIAMEHGWTPPREDPTGGKRLYSHGARFHDAVGGRIQCRFTAEFPDGMDMEGRVTVLKAFCAYFEERNLPYVAVIHEPSASNHRKNWHFHLAYYDRPCLLFTNDVGDHLGERSPGKKKQIDHAFVQRLRTIGTDALQPFVAKQAYDFEVPVTYVRPDRHKATIRPFGQGKPRYLKDEMFIPEMRKRYADLVNAELARVQAKRRVSELRFDALGIRKEPDRHLGSNANRLESVGIPTMVGVDNERKQFEYKQLLRRNDYIRILGAIKRRAISLKKQVLAVSGGPRDIPMTDNLASSVCDLTRFELLAAGHRRLADDLQAGIERARSRAEEVDATCERRLAFGWDESKARESAAVSLYIQRQKEAQAHLSGVTRFFQEDLRRIREAHEKAEELDTKAKALRAEVNAKLAELERLRERRSIELQLAAIQASATAGKQAGENSPRSAAPNAGQPTKIGAHQPLQKSADDPEVLPPSAPKADLSLPPMPDPRPTRTAKRQAVHGTDFKHQASLAMVMEAVGVLANKGTHLRRDDTTTTPTYRYSDVAVLAPFGLKPEDFSSQQVQTRLAAVYKQQRVDYERLIGFAKKSPSRISIVEHPYGKVRMLEAKNAPPELAALIRKYAGSAEVQGLVGRARAAGLEAQRQAAVGRAQDPAKRTSVGKMPSGDQPTHADVIGPPLTVTGSEKEAGTGREPVHDLASAAAQSRTTDKRSQPGKSEGGENDRKTAPAASPSQVAQDAAGASYREMLSQAEFDEINERRLKSFPYEPAMEPSAAGVPERALSKAAAATLQQGQGASGSDKEGADASPLADEVELARKAKDRSPDMRRFLEQQKRPGIGG